MPNPRLAFRYAKSLIGLALEKGQLEEVHADMLWLQKVSKTNRDFVNLLRSPIINVDTKKKIIQAVSKDNLGPLTTAFITLVATKGRESSLPEIANAFMDAYRENKGIHTVRLTTAAPISDSVRTAIVDQVKRSSGYAHIELEEKIDPDLIGGFVLQIGDKLIDGSIAYDLKSITKQFENNDFIYKLR